MKIDLSPTSIGRVVVTTVVGTLACIGVAIYFDLYNLSMLDEPARLRALFTDIAVPLILAGPLLAFFSAKLRELALAHERLTVIAATDSLTQVLSRSAFATLVDAYLKQVGQPKGPVRGSLLIVDADHFKAVNDQFGHDKGDEALIAIAQTLRRNVSSTDLVGRMGGEEFGVFLPDVQASDANRIAERLRAAIRNIDFRPDGYAHPLSVSIGGASFTSPVEFKALFQAADRQLYAAKGSGRDRVSFAPRLAAA